MICPECNGRGESSYYVETHRDENSVTVEQRKGICRTCNGSGEKKQTNADHIRVMSDEKLAEAFFNLCEKLNDGTMNDLSDLYCDGKNGCIDKDGNITCTPDM